MRPARRGGRGSGRRASSPRRRCSSRRGRRRGRGPPSARNVSWRGGRPPVLGPDVALDDEPALDQLADALGDDRPAEAGPRDELGARARPPEPDLVEDDDERVERLVRQRAPRRGARRPADHAGMIRLPPFDRATFALDRSKYDVAREARAIGAEVRRGSAAGPSRPSRLAVALPAWELPMSRIADIGAAVIGTGFIGTVHVEALRRIGVQVRGVLGSTPERGAARAAALGVPRAYPSLDDAARRPDASTSSTSPRPTTSTSRRRRRSSPPASTSSARSRWR